MVVKSDTVQCGESVPTFLSNLMPTLKFQYAAERLHGVTSHGTAVCVVAALGA
jgi:hypothetical protein